MEELVKLTSELAPGEGIRDTLIPSLKMIKTSTPFEKVHTVYNPSLCVIIQGEKDVSLGQTTLTYAPGEYIVVTVDLPITGEVTKASAKKPYLCLMLELDPVIIFDVLKDQVRTKPMAVKRGIFVGQFPFFRQ